MQWLQQMRLGKYLAHAGVASRRAAERVIADGRERLIERGSGTVAEVLSAANVSVHERDQVTPAPGASVRDGDVMHFRFNV